MNPSAPDNATPCHKTKQHARNWISSNHWCRQPMYRLSRECRSVIFTPRRVKPELPSLHLLPPWIGWSTSSEAEDACKEKGCVTGLVPENLPQPLLSEPAETSPEGHDTHRSLSLHQAFHMSQPSLSSAPGWRNTRKRTHSCFSCYFTTVWVRLLFFFCLCACVWLRLLALLLSL